MLGSAHSVPEFTHFYVMTQQILNKAIMLSVAGRTKTLLASLSVSVTCQGQVTL